jgi:hypothetical protein
MKTFVARFVRPSGTIGVIHIMASSSVCAMLEVMNKEKNTTGLNVQPCRLAALLTHYPNVGTTERSGNDSAGLLVSPSKTTIRDDPFNSDLMPSKRFGNVQEP